MLDAHQFGDWCRRLGLSPHAERVIQKIRSSLPVRHGRSGRGNVGGRYPSHKMAFR